MTLKVPVYREAPLEVRSRLRSLGLQNVDFGVIADAMRTEYASSNPFYSHAKPGTYAYHEGLHALRQQVVGIDDWKKFRDNKNLEGVRSPSRKIIILISGVDHACQSKNPRKRTRCGAATEAAAPSSGLLFEDLPVSIPPSKTGDDYFWLMVDEFGNAELSQPIIVNGNYVDFVERNIIVVAEDDHYDPSLLDDDDAVTDFNPEILRKMS